MQQDAKVQYMQALASSVFFCFRSWVQFPIGVDKCSHVTRWAQQDGRIAMISAETGIYRERFRVVGTSQAKEAW
jgi:hypothetical protein